ncbi:hypothetical protein COLO4_33883 [Corchorus olitorius]|uniref:Uncharacterized protein n=1 Tax=Corchorus olitorius TaxID=93759 RepID=A0A1R3GQ55_9ROSI|nr:hypothetical protein COLO4_33883 [Corchorus olitorius]
MALVVYKGKDQENELNLLKNKSFKKLNLKRSDLKRFGHKIKKELVS